MESLLKFATDNLRRRCQHSTVYSHDEMCEWLQEALPPQWKVYKPAVNEKALAACWPPEGGSVRKAVVAWLSARGCKDPEYLLNGHCEAMALLLSHTVEEKLLAGELPETLVDTAHTVALEMLESKKPEEAAQLVFPPPFLRGFVEGTATWDTSVWNFAADSDVVPINGLAPFLYGGTGVQKRIGDLAKNLESGIPPYNPSKICSMPLYTLNYIWDGDELDQTDLEAGADETAMYSCHAVGLVLDATRRVLIIADPNAGLLPGGNIEFLAVPQRPREAGPSTALSRFDLEKAAEAEQKKKTPGGKKRGHAPPAFVPKDDSDSDWDQPLVRRLAKKPKPA